MSVSSVGRPLPSSADDAGVRDQGDPGEDLIRVNDDAVTAVDPLDPRRPIPDAASMRVCHRSGGSST